MITDQQYWRLLMSVKTGKTVALSALKSGMSEKTARKYLKSQILPSEQKKARGGHKLHPSSSLPIIVMDYTSKIGF